MECHLSMCLVGKCLVPPQLMTVDCEGLSTRNTKNSKTPDQKSATFTIVSPHLYRKSSHVTHWPTSLTPQWSYSFLEDKENIIMSKDAETWICGMLEKHGYVCASLLSLYVHENTYAWCTLNLFRCI